MRFYRVFLFFYKFAIFRSCDLVRFQLEALFPTSPLLALASLTPFIAQAVTRTYRYMPWNATFLSLFVLLVVPFFGPRRPNGFVESAFWLSRRLSPGFTSTPPSSPGSPHAVPKISANCNPASDLSVQTCMTAT
jgi:hypothetical protein